MRTVIVTAVASTSWMVDLITQSNPTFHSTVLVFSTFCPFTKTTAYAQQRGAFLRSIAGSVGAMEGEISFSELSAQHALCSWVCLTWNMLSKVPKSGKNKSSGLNLCRCFCFPVCKIQAGMCCSVHCYIPYSCRAGYFGIWFCTCWKTLSEGRSPVLLGLLLLLVLFFRNKELLYTVWDWILTM